MNARPFRDDGTTTALWWVTVTDSEGAQVYDGPAPCPSDLVELTPDADGVVRNLYRFDMRPMGERANG